MGDWNAVYTVYCDGSSATSARDDSPVPVGGGASIYLRGFDVLQAWLEELEVLGGFKTRSTDVVITGTSAGGMATYIHAPFIRSLLPPSASVVAAPDAGYFMCVLRGHAPCVG
jgi:O-palmitoleoyl-L-serine hydrolase